VKELETIILPEGAEKENLKFTNVSFFKDDEHGTIFLEGFKNFRIIHRAYLF
jgi:hypothetical protein